MGWLGHIAIVALTRTEPLQTGAALATDHWLADERNVIQLRLDAPAFA